MRPDIQQVVQLMKRRDTKSLKEELALLQSTVFPFSMKVCGQRQEAEDTMQEVFRLSFGGLFSVQNVCGSLIEVRSIGVL